MSGVATILVCGLGYITYDFCLYITDKSKQEKLRHYGLLHVGVKKFVKPLLKLAAFIIIMHDVDEILKLHK